LSRTQVVSIAAGQTIMAAMKRTKPEGDVVKIAKEIKDMI